jgi:hypothetical protein
MELIDLLKNPLVMKINYLSILLFTCLVSFLDVAQSQPDNRIECLALVKKDSVVLRWVPASIPVWQSGVKYGYVINRYTIAKEGVFIPDGLSRGERLTSVPVTPITNERFDAIALSDPRIAIVQEAIYGTGFQLPSEGQDYSGFIKSYRDIEVRFGFALFICDLSPLIADAAGLRFTDRNIKPGERYVYNITLSNVPDGLQIDPAVIVIDVDQITSLPVVNDLQAVFLDKKVNLQWPVMLYRGTYTAYIIEKSINGTDFKPVSDLPLLNIAEDDNPGYFVYTDSLVSNNQETWYRVKGISPFGEEGPASDIIKGKGATEFSAYAVIDSTAVIGNDKVFLHWRITETKSAPVTGISVMWSEKYNGVYKNITSILLSPETRTYVDSRPKLSNYYKIVLTGEKGLTSSSFPSLVQTEDNEAPAAPSMLAGKVDTVGIVSIAWKQNQEPDIIGYKVFRANAPHEDFIAVSYDLLSFNFYYDTINLNTLTKKIFYKVVAVDNSFNNSGYSSILELSCPDTIPPAKALIKRIDLLNGKVTMKLEGSPSNDIGVYKLMRVAENGKDTMTLNTWQSDLAPVYEDILSTAGNYKYILKTIDLAGNVSFFNRSIIVPSSMQIVIALKAEQSVNGKTIILSWEIPKEIIPDKTLIYRSKTGGPLSVYKTLLGEQLIYEDNSIEIGMEYNYRVRIFDSASNAILNSALTRINPFSKSNAK